MHGPPRGLIAAIVFAVAAAGFVRVPLLPDIGADLDLTAGKIGLLTTAFGIGRLVMDVPAGRLAAAVGPAAGLTGGGVLLAAACLVFAGSQGFAVALAASALIGCASAVTNTTGMLAFATATGAERRGASMALYMTALMSGQMIGPAIGGAIGSLMGWRAGIASAAGIGIAVAVACAPWLRTAGGHKRGPPPASGTPARAVVPPGGYAGRRELLALAGAPFATFFGVAGMTQTVVPLIGDRELGFSASAIGIAIAVGAASRFASAWIAGAASDRHSRKAVLVPSLATLTAGAVVLALSAGVVGWCASILLVAAGSSGVSVAAAAVADRVPQRRLGHELGLFRLVGDLGLVVGPAIAGFAYQASGARAAALVCAAVFAGAAIAAALWTHREPTQGRRSESTAATVGE